MHFLARPRMFCDSKGGLPITISYSRQPSAQMSLLALYGLHTVAADERPSRIGMCWHVKGSSSSSEPQLQQLNALHGACSGSGARRTCSSRVLARRSTAFRSASSPWPGWRPAAWQRRGRRS